jgi:hypothetical protein
VTSVNIIVVYKKPWRIIFELDGHINYFPSVQIYQLFLGISYVFLMPYVTGAMAKTLLKSIGFCKLCRADLKTEVSSEEHKLIEAREYKPNILLRPRSKFVVLFGLCSQVRSHYLPILCSESNFHTKLVLIVNANIKSDI